MSILGLHKVAAQEVTVEMYLPAGRIFLHGIITTILLQEVQTVVTAVPQEAAVLLKGAVGRHTEVRLGAAVRPIAVLQEAAADHHTGAHPEAAAALRIAVLQGVAVRRIAVPLKAVVEDHLTAVEVHLPAAALHAVAVTLQVEEGQGKSELN